MICYYINLDSRPDRRLKMEYELAKIEMPVERFRAIEITPVAFKSDYLTLPVLGCVESHKALYVKIAKTQGNFAAILEDDILINNSKRLKQILTKIEELSDSSILDSLQIGFLDLTFLDLLRRKLADSIWFCEMILLGYFLPKLSKYFNGILMDRVRVNRAKNAWKVSREFLPYWVIPDDFKAGAQFYVVNKKFANQVSALNEPAFLSADQFLISVSQMCIFSMYRLSGNLAKQDNSSISSIGIERFRNYTKNIKL